MTNALVVEVSDGVMTLTIRPERRNATDGAVLEGLEVALGRASRPVPDLIEEMVRSFAVNFAGDREFAGLLAAHAWLASGMVRKWPTCSACWWRRASGEARCPTPLRPSKWQSCSLPSCSSPSGTG